MSIEAGLFAFVLVAAVGLFVKTRRGGASSTNTIAHAADALPQTHDARR